MVSNWGYNMFQTMYETLADDPLFWDLPNGMILVNINGWIWGEGSFMVSSYPIGSMYAIYDDIYHQYTPNVSIYTSTMDPMGIWVNMS